MQYQQFGERYIVRLESGEPIVETLTRFCKEQRIEFANLSAAGAVEWVRLGYWNARTRQYEYREVEEQMEVVSFQGNSSLKDGEPFLHLHGVFGRQDFSVLGGHIKEARTHPTLEAWLRADSSLPGPPAPSGRILGDLVAWLRDGPASRAPLPPDRAASLARSFVLEFLKQGGHFDRTTRERRHEALVLLETYFGEADGAERPTGWGRMPRPERAGREIS